VSEPRLGIDFKIPAGTHSHSAEGLTTPFWICGTGTDGDNALIECGICDFSTTQNRFRSKKHARNLTPSGNMPPSGETLQLTTMTAGD
jgi:hypothetical protein